MITIKTFLEIINYEITEGSDYGWSCYGSNAYVIDHWKGDYETCSLSIIFDKKDQTVYEISAYDYKNNLAYRWTNPMFVEARKAEAKSKNCNDNIAWDGVFYINIDEECDILDKSKAIFNGIDYDKRVTISIDLEDDLLLKLCMLAHERDITLNEFINNILKEELERFKNESTDN